MLFPFLPKDGEKRRIMFERWAGLGRIEVVAGDRRRRDLCRVDLVRDDVLRLLPGTCCSSLFPDHPRRSRFSGGGTTAPAGARRGCRRMPSELRRVADLGRRPFGLLHGVPINSSGRSSAPSRTSSAAHRARRRDHRDPVRLPPRKFLDASNDRRPLRAGRVTARRLSIAAALAVAAFLSSTVAIRSRSRRRRLPADPAGALEIRAVAGDASSPWDDEAGGRS